MIDTIRFKIPINEKIFKKVKNKSVETRRFDHLIHREIFRISKQDIKVGSYDRKISIYVPDNDCMFLELSVPKFIIGHNVWLINFEEFYNAIEKLQMLLSEYFEVKITEKEKWEIMRIDLCYAWKFQTENQAEQVLNVLQNFNFARKKKSVYDTSVMYVGHTYTLKFYLKHPEFFKHDFKYLRDNNHIDFAYNMFNNSKGILRFEATLRSQYLHYHFSKKHIFIEDLNKKILSDILIKLFNKYMGGFNMKYMKRKEIKNRLQDYWGLKKGGRLWIFYVFLTSEGKGNLKDIYAYSTIWQYLKEIKEAGISLSYDNINFPDFNLNIPSENVVNSIEF